MDLDRSWVSFLRSREKARQSSKRVQCIRCGDEMLPDDFSAHFRTMHPDVLRVITNEKDLNSFIQTQYLEGGSKVDTAATVGGRQPGTIEQKDEDAPLTSALAPERGHSPSSLKRESSITRSQSPPKRSRARPQSVPHATYSQEETTASTDFYRGQTTTKGGRLWNPDDDPPTARSTLDRPISHRTRTSPAQSRGQRYGQSAQHSFNQRPFAGEDEQPVLVKQPDTKPISQEQLVAEVKGIYAGLVMVESKCIEVDNAQSAQSDAAHKLNNEQWQALVALHRTLLQEHHDFFLASQHPSASPALQRLASKYAMPARMWRHGIHSFLELLRHRLPLSLEHMLTFIYLAYSMMALLYETVPTFEDTWIECLGDLGRYRMAIEDDDIRDREVWTAVSRHWYSKASDKAPTTGRLYHHLAILARPNALQQLFYYAKALCVPVPFASARESVMTLFEPILLRSSHQPSRLTPIDAAFVRAHGILFSKKQQEELSDSVQEFLGLLDNHISRNTRRWMESGYFIAIANSCSLTEYASEDNVIMKGMRPAKTEEHLIRPAQDQDQIQGQGQSQDVAMEGGVREIPSGGDFEKLLSLVMRTHEIVLRRYGDPNILPYLHVSLVFIHHVAHFPAAMVHLEHAFPWKLTAMMLNTLLLPYKSLVRIESPDFPGPAKEGEAPRPLPDDFAMRGLLWAERYFPAEWFSQARVDDDEKYFEVASMTDERRERVLWLGCRIAALGVAASGAPTAIGLTYDAAGRQFGVLPQYDVDIETMPSQSPGPRGHPSPVMDVAYLLSTDMELEPELTPDLEIVPDEEQGDASLPDAPAEPGPPTISD